MNDTANTRDPATDGESKTQWHPLIASDRVEGTPVHDRDGEKLGTVRKLMLGKIDGQVRYVIMGSGGCSALARTTCLCPGDSLDFDTELGGYKLRSLAKADFEREKAPSFERGQEPDWSEDYDRRIRLYLFHAM